MSIRAKFRVTEIQRREIFSTLRDENGNKLKNDQGAELTGNVEVQTIHMTPVYSSNPNSENHKFWESSPGGKLELNCINMNAAKQFLLGKEYYLDFTLADIMDNS